LAIAKASLKQGEFVMGGAWNEKPWGGILIFRMFFAARSLGSLSHKASLG
jgi:hypothetical protein